MQFIHSILTTIGPFFLLLGVLIFVHEFGHFIVAKFFGVRVEVFSLGFGKKILQYKKGDTTYCLSLIPLGGYVKMYGDDPNKEIPKEEQQFSFLHKPVWPRIAIVAAGPLINFFFAIVVFAVVGMVGEQMPANYVGDVVPATPAYEAGFRSGDKIERVNGTPVNSWIEINDIIQMSANKEIHFDLLRNDSELNISATPTLEENENVLSFHDEVGKINGLSTFSQSSLVGMSSINALAAKWGIRNLDIIEEINGEKIYYLRQINDALAKAPETFDIKVRNYDAKEDSSSRTVTVENWKAPENSKDLLASIGLEDPSTFLLAVRKDSPAYSVGLEKGDKLAFLDGQPVSGWNQVLEHVKSFKENQKFITFGVIREGILKELKIKPEMTEVMTSGGQREDRFTVGIVPAFASIAGETYTRRTLNPINAVVYGAKKSVEWTGLMIMSFVKLAQGKVSPKNIGGVITIGRVASQSFEVGLAAFLRMMAIISINLFLLNLFPIPVLDGGHLMFFFFEAVSGSPISIKKMEIAQTVGIVLLMSLMTFALFNDVTNWISSSGW